MQDLATVGVASVPLLTEAAQRLLQCEAEHLAYRPKSGTVGKDDAVVHEEYSVCDAFAASSPFTDLRAATQLLFDRQLAEVEPYPFTSRLQFNAMVLQRYEPGQLGITPHRDRLSSINLICIYTLAGQGQFYRCADRQGTDTVAIDTTPGNAILLRAPGFLGSQARPFHTIGNIRSTRYSFALRQQRSNDVAIEIQG